jgi:hypothetical protein
MFRLRLAIAQNVPVQWQSMRDLSEVNGVRHLLVVVMQLVVGVEDDHYSDLDPMAAVVGGTCTATLALAPPRRGTCCCRLGGHSCWSIHSRKVADHSIPKSAGWQRTGVGWSVGA